MFSVKPLPYRVGLGTVYSLSSSIKSFKNKSLSDKLISLKTGLIAKSPYLLKFSISIFSSGIFIFNFFKKLKIIAASQCAWQLPQSQKPELNLGLFSTLLIPKMVMRAIHC